MKIFKNILSNKKSSSKKRGKKSKNQLISKLSNKWYAVIFGLLFAVVGTIIIVKPFALTTSITYSGQLSKTAPSASYTVSTGTGTLSAKVKRTHNLKLTVTDTTGRIIAQSTTPTKAVAVTTNVAPGTYVITVSYNGTIPKDQGFSLSISYPTNDTAQPIVIITGPTASTVSGQVTINTSVTDNTGISKVEFLIDNSLVASKTTTPYTYAWDSTKYTNASHQITVKAFDLQGNVGSAIVAVSVNNATAAPTPVSPQTPAWQDEFNSLDMTTSSYTGTWRPNDFWQNINTGYRDFAGTSWNLNPNEFTGHTPFTIANGVLTITAKRTPAELHDRIVVSMQNQQQTGSVPAWSGGMLITNKAKKTFKYGYIEYRARFPLSGKGMFPALWLYAADQSNNAESKGGAEIDLFEIFGDAEGDQWDTTLHFRNNQNQEVRPSVHKTMYGDTKDWHVYALDWQSTYMRFYRDGTLYYEVTGADAEWFNTAMSLRLNYAMDANWFYGLGLQSNSTTPSPLSMDIDYVRVYAQKP